MKQTQLTYWEAIKIGLLLSAGLAFLFLMIRPESWSFTIFSMNAMIVVFLFGITGALADRFLSRTSKGAWLGAWVASNVPLD